MATQSVFAGSYVVAARVTQGIPVITVKPNSAAAEPAPASVLRGDRDRAVTFSDLSKVPQITAVEPRAKSDRPDLSEAAIVVSGGRGVGSREGFDVVE